MSTTQQPGEAPLCTRCNQHRDSNTHIANIPQSPYANYHPYTDATVRVTFERLIIDALEYADLSFLQQDYSDVTDASQRAKYKAQDEARLAAYDRGEWHMIAIRARARIEIKRPGFTTLYDIKSPGLWGVESDSSDEYLNAVYAEEKNTLKHDIEAIVAGPITWQDSGT